MVSGRNWTDAVVAAPLAGSLGAPVLTTPSDELRADARSFLRRTGVSNAVIIGADSDTDGVGPTVVASLEQLGIVTERITRPDQYATSVAAARRLGTPGDMRGLGRTAIVASGRVFADALVAGTFAAKGAHPILLTKPEIFRRDVARYLTETGVEHVVLMGGTAALQPVIEDSIKELNIKVTRLDGATRYDTASLGGGVRCSPLFPHVLHGAPSRTGPSHTFPSTRSALHPCSRACAPPCSLPIPPRSRQRRRRISTLSVR